MANLADTIKKSSKRLWLLYIIKLKSLLIVSEERVKFKVTRSRATNIFIAAIVALVVIAIQFTNTDTAHAFSGGNGSQGSPYRISNCSQLQNIKDDLDAYYELTKNIDCSETTSWFEGAGFEPIGSNASRFTGFLDGYGHTITGLFINMPSTNNVGLFGHTDGDGTADANQANVTSYVNTVTSDYSVLETSCENNSNVQLGAESAENKDSAYQYPVGLMGFIASGCGDYGVSVTVTQYFYGNYNAADFVARKWNGTGYTAIDGATITNVTIGGQSVLKVEYQVVDGGPLDRDGEANGRIDDPSGPATAAVGVPNTGLRLKR